MTYRYTARTLLSLLATSLVLLGATPAATQPVAPQRTELGALVLDGVPAHSARVTRTLDTWLAGRSAGFQAAAAIQGRVVPAAYVEEGEHAVA